MRLMDQPENPPADIRLNSTLRLLTVFKDTRIGKVVAFDPASKLVTLRKEIASRQGERKERDL